MESFIIVVAVSSLAVGALVGAVTANALWRDDCDRIGAHVVSTQVYTCAPKEPKK